MVFFAELLVKVTDVISRPSYLLCQMHYRLQRLSGLARNNPRNNHVTIHVTIHFIIRKSIFFIKTNVLVNIIRNRRKTVGFGPVSFLKKKNYIFSFKIRIFARIPNCYVDCYVDCYVIVTWLLRDCYVQGLTISGAYSASGTGDILGYNLWVTTT